MTKEKRNLIRQVAASDIIGGCLDEEDVSVPYQTNIEVADGGYWVDARIWVYKDDVPDSYHEA
jgi:hypothetical protein